MKLFLRRIALGVVSLALVLSVAEVVARVIVARQPAPGPRALPEEWRGLPQIQGIHTLAQPNVRGLHAGTLFETNSAGFRGPERAPEKPPGVFRIVVTGDSIAMGWGVPYDDTYAARIERALNASPGSRSVEVLDIAIAGLSAREAVIRFSNLGLSYDPDLVIYGFTLNDIENDHYRRGEAGFRSPLPGIQSSPSRLWRLIGPRWVSLTNAIFLPRGSYLRELDDNYFRNPEAWGMLLHYLERFGEVAREREICAVVLVHTRLTALHRFHPLRRQYAAVGEAAEARGLYVAQSFPSFVGTADTDLWVSSVDAHPNPEGHRILADVVLRRLESLPESCWDRSPRRGVPAP